MWRLMCLPQGRSLNGVYLMGYSPITCFFGNQTKRRHPVIIKGAKPAVPFGQDGAFFGSVEPEIFDGHTNRIVIFLFRVTVVVFVVGSASPWLNMPCKTPVVQGFVDTFHAVIVMSAIQREGKPAVNIRKSLKNPVIGGIEQDAFLYPPEKTSVPVNVL